MKYWKVYGQNCKAVEPIKEIDIKQFNKEIEPLAQNVFESSEFNNLDIDWENSDQVQAATQKVYEQARTILDENEILSCGDYCIIACEDVPRARPCMCGFDTELVME